MSTPPADASVRFGPFELQRYERRLLVDGEPAALGSRALDLLFVLVDQPGRLVGRQELLDRVWPGLVVEDNNIAAQVSALRKVLGGDVIATVPGRGYRFTAPLRVPPPSGPTPPSIDATDPSPKLRTNLPRPLPVLFGRDDDLAALGTLVEQHVLVSIVGAGGMGKSLLSQHLLDARRGAYAHGVCWVALATLADPAGLPGAIATALGLQHGTGEPLAGLVAALAPLELLLVLDNAEHLLADVARVAAAMLAVAPGLRVVVTSQAPLKMAAERVYRLDALAVPQGALPARQAMAFGAVALFVERAQAADARFALTDANAAAVIELCRALDGLALAIELAAARAPMLGVQRLVASTKDRLKLLTAGRNRAAPARQQTLRAALEWSHGFLDERERCVLRRLGVVAGSASLDLVQQVGADLPGLDAWAVLDALCVLVDRSLVAVLSGDDAGEPRYRLLESTRAFALEQLTAAGELEALRRRHAEAVRSLFDAARDAVYGGRLGIAAQRRVLEPDLDNAREAFAWARDAGEAELALALGATLLGALPDSMYAERMALAADCEMLVGPRVPVRLRLRVWLQLSAAWANTRAQRSAEAAAQALALSRGLSAVARDPFQHYLALCACAVAASRTLDGAAAEAALADLATAEDPAWPPYRLRSGAEAAAAVAQWRGDGAALLRFERRALALEYAAGGSGVDALNNLVNAELAAGDAFAAVRSGTALMAMLEGSRDELALAYARVNLAAAQLELGDLRRARELAQAGWAQAQRFDLQPLWADYLGLLAALEARPRAAARLAGYALVAYTARGDRRQANEAAAVARTRVLVCTALGDGCFDRLHAEGAALTDAAIAALAFGVEDA